MTSATTRLAAIGLTGLLLTGCATAQRMMGTANPCQNATVTLYFETGQDDVGDIGRQIIKATAQRLKSCPVDELLLLGLADPQGAPQTNLELSKRRAEHVRDDFIAAGLPVQRFTIRAAGENGAESSSGVIEPVRRRVDVTVVVKGSKG